MSKETIFKIHKRENPFVQIDKNLLFDTEISWKAKGILAYLLSRPTDWQVYENEIVKHSTDGRDSVRSGIKELIAGGYIERFERRNEKGHFRGYEYNVYEAPNRSGKSHNGESDIGEVAPTNKEITKKEETKKVISMETSFNDVVRYYADAFKYHKRNEHFYLSQEQMNFVESGIKKAKRSLGLTDDQMKDVIDRHFETLPEDNQGHVLYFVGEQGHVGVLRRHVQEMGLY